MTRQSRSWLSTTARKIAALTTGIFARYSQAYRIHEEGGIKAGLQALNHLDPACITLDYAMPDGAGLEFLKQLQSSERTRSLPVIMLTGTGDECHATVWRAWPRPCLSKAIVDAHHGSITAASAGPNQGTTFTVELTAFAEAPAAELSTPSLDGNYSANVLLVEDHLDTGRLLSRTLMRVGYRVHLATSIASASEVFRSEPIDLIVSDFGLPDGHGTKLLEQESAIRPTKAIALSGYGSENDLEATRRAGFLMHLVKPILPAMLQTAIERVLSGAAPNESTAVT